MVVILKLKINLNKQSSKNSQKKPFHLLHFEIICHIFELLSFKFNIRMKKGIFILLLSLSTGSIYSQQARINSASSEMPKEQYLSTANEYAILFNGKEYNRYTKQTKNHPYLVQKDFADGEISFGGIYYPHVQMLLDLYKDELIVQAPSKPYSIIVEKERFDSARLHGYQIIKPAIRGWENLGGNEYVLLLHDGNYPVIKKYFIQYEEKVNGLSVEASFRIKEQYYICKENYCHPVRNKSSLLKLFPERKKELGQFIKTRKLNFRKNPEQAFISIVEHYETLNR